MTLNTKKINQTKLNKNKNKSINKLFHSLCTSLFFKTKLFSKKLKMAYFLARTMSRFFKALGNGEIKPFLF